MAGSDCPVYLRIGTHRFVSCLCFLTHDQSEAKVAEVVRHSDRRRDAMDDPRHHLPGEAAPTCGKSHPSCFPFILILCSSSMRMRRVGFVGARVIFAVLDLHLSSMVCAIYVYVDGCGADMGALILIFARVYLGVLKVGPFSVSSCSCLCAQQIRLQYC